MKRGSTGGQQPPNKGTKKIMAKSGTLIATPDVDASDLADNIIWAEATQTNMGGLVTDVLAKSTDPVKVHANIGDRRARVYPVGANFEHSGKLIGTITRDDATARSSTMTMAAGESGLSDAETALKNAINAALGATKPTFSIGSLLSAIENANAGLNEPVGTLNVLVSQAGDGSVEVYSGDIDPTEGAVLADITIQLTASPGTGDTLPFE